MFMFLLQSAILLTIAFILGCIIGCWLRRMFANDTVAPKVAAARTVALATVALKAAPETAVPAAPAIVVPVKLIEPIVITAKATEKKVATKAKPAVKVSNAKAAVSVKKPIALKLAKPIGGKPDNLTLINGIGNVLEKRLFDLGVFHFEQIANWTKAQALDFGKAVGFPGRVEREEWVKEAALFAKGGTTEHARKVEAGDIPTSRKSTAAEKNNKK
jgi:predicted flap endonuclease-1-like 5' DNA nuclease